MLIHIGKIERLLSILLVTILTTFIFLGLGSFTCKSAIAVVTQIEETSGEVLYRSQVKLDDDFGKVWQVVLFKQVYPGQKSQINLRLVGFPGSQELIHPQPLRITSNTGKIWNASDIFLDEAPAPTVGQYDFTEILPQLPLDSLTLAIPLPGKKSINISVPTHVVKEWQTIITSDN
ncbi:DUF3122 domain-containing protein [Sphaerospermopsis aphanizomenoides BCCUSP55]|uniref:DUF3122 domain-containing protein n=1 Tax=Sphaerospermopsis aphanizomenoides TaxID=459663 RepID=UPI000AFEC4C8|nr:DUF3122 domain-containing protein [Sphaerospermopsis aphanizomenoides]MBK1990858.1 DUF3122 domain-containing protein [Sphaerospermopsis aphanizomenoides BCCUSP55]